MTPRDLYEWAVKHDVQDCDIEIQYRDDGMLEIALQKKEFEEHLNEMWRIYSTGNISQIVEYNKQVESIKQCGYKVMRNSEGNHKLILIKNN